MLAMTRRKTGKIIKEIGAAPEKHELKTTDFLASLGHDITILAPNPRRGNRTPDIEMLGLKWEIKSPIGNSSGTVRRAFKAAIRQSYNIVFDLRRSVVLANHTYRTPNA